MQLSVNRARIRRKGRAARPAPTLGELRPGEAGVLDRLDLPDDMSRRLMELGFLPGSAVVAALSAPGGDPRVFRVDGAEIALRRETAACLILRGAPAEALPES
jgi:ferrous iron transport protein A